MTVHTRIPATPLKNITWQRDRSKVTMRFADHVDEETQMHFLIDLMNECKQQVYDLTMKQVVEYEMTFDPETGECKSS